MAEGFARHLKSETMDAYSAGITSHGLNRVAVEVMWEAGIDISQQVSKALRRLRGVEFDYVVTVCDKAFETCPVFPGDVKIVHQAFDDPPRLGEDAMSEEEGMGHYRRVRDEIRAFVEMMPELLELLARR